MVGYGAGHGNLPRGLYQGLIYGGRPESNATEVGCDSNILGSYYLGKNSHAPALKERDTFNYTGQGDKRREPEKREGKEQKQKMKNERNEHVN